MAKKSKTVVFFGSGPVAAQSLKLLLEHTAVEAVITKPRGEHHKGEVPVLELAEKHRLKTFTPANKSELSELFAGKPTRSELGIVIDYGIIIAQDVIDYFPLGIINSHFSLLPEWRGADPITFSILSGQKRTGVSLMLITAGLDEGPILSVGEKNLDDSITTPALTRSLLFLSDALLQHTLPKHFNGKTKLISQEEAAKNGGWSSKPTYSRKLLKEDGEINWDKQADELEREVRAFIEWPKSHAKIGDIDVVITSSKAVKEQVGKPGTVTVLGKRLMVACGAGSLEILNLKPAGKKEMPAAAFLAGYGQRLTS